MKKLLAIAALTVVSTYARAGVELRTRFDYASTLSYKLTSEYDKGDERSEFIPNYARLNGSGAVGDATAKMSLNLTGISPAGNGDLFADSFVDYLYISKPLADGFTLHAGKIETFVGGIEGAQKQLGNVYLATVANGGNAGNWSPSGTVAGAMTGGASVDLASGAPITGRGLGLSWNYGMGQLDAFLTNDSNNTTGTGNSQRKHNMGLQWSGNFMDGMIKPAIGYAAGYQDEDTTGTTSFAGRKVGTTNINVGADFAINEALGLTAEYLSNEGKSDSNTTAQQEDDKLTSWYVAAAYKMDAWKPFAKFEMSSFKDQEASVDSNTTSFDRTAFTIGTNWTPSNDGLSYHVAYLSASDKYKAVNALTNNDKVDWSQILVGLTYNADLLK